MCSGNSSLRSAAIASLDVSRLAALYELDGSPYAAESGDIRPAGDVCEGTASLRTSAATSARVSANVHTTGSKCNVAREWKPGMQVGSYRLSADRRSANAIATRGNPTNGLAICPLASIVRHKTQRSSSVRIDLGRSG